MKRGDTVVLIGAHRTGNARLVAGLVTVVAAVLAASVLALAAARTAEAAFPGTNGRIVFERDPDGYRVPEDPKIYTISFTGDTRSASRTIPGRTRDPPTRPTARR